MKKRDNEPLSALTHLIAMLLSIAGLVLMVVFGAMHSSASHIVGFSIFGTSLIMLYGASFVYHFASKQTPAKSTLQRLDHAMIFVLIAGTYTPICLALPERGWGWSLFGIIWGLAVIGFVLKITGIKMKNHITASIYLLMGWLIIIAILPISEWLNTSAMVWLVTGGIFYTLGCVFFILDNKVHRTKWLGMHEIFHVFVMMGSFSHFWLMIKYITHI